MEGFKSSLKDYYVLSKRQLVVSVEPKKYLNDEYKNFQALFSKLGCFKEDQLKHMILNGLS